MKRKFKGQLISMIIGFAVIDLALCHPFLNLERMGRGFFKLLMSPVAHYSSEGYYRFMPEIPLPLQPHRGLTF
jgi:hypothetical protein